MSSQSKIDTNNKRFFIHTLGCKVNQYESEAMRERLLDAGFKECLSRDIADIYIINTCTVTRAADRESRYIIGFLHRANPKAKIVVTGCYVERNADKISFLPGVAHIIKNADKYKIADILSGIKTCVPCEDLIITDFKGHDKAYVKIQDGCENSCSYCAVPIVRGPIRSKALDSIIQEVRGLVLKGFKEIVLTGICLGAWGKDLESNHMAKGVGLEGPTLVDVLKTLEKIDGDFRIRLSSLEPKYVTDKLIDFMAEHNKKICPHLHIPFQSGDDEILKRMNRSYTTAEYKVLVNEIKSRIKDVAITTDILIGFPGESDANFKNTVDFIKEVLPLRTHIFTFSRREGTPAYEMAGQMNVGVLRKRYYELYAASLSVSYIFRRKFLGKELDVLAETRRDKRVGLLMGYSDNYIHVLFEGDDSVMKRIVKVRVIDTSLLYTFGTCETR